MKITCPDCGFSRDVPEDKIPKRSVRVTCPKCGVKFQFRAVEDIPAERFDLKTSPAPDEDAGMDREPLQSDDQAEAVDEAVAGQQDGSTEPVEPETMAKGRERPEEKWSDQAEPMVDDPREDRNETVAKDAGVDRGDSSAGYSGKADEPYEPQPKSRPTSASDSRSDGRDDDIWDRLENMPGDPEYDEPHDSTGYDEETESQAWRTLRDVEGDKEPAPWEDLGRYGLPAGFYLTIKRALTAPGRFFERLPVNQGIVKPLVFSLLMVEFQVAMQLLWIHLGLLDSPLFSQIGSLENPPPAMPGAEEAGSGISPLGLLLAAPAVGAVYQFLFSVVIHGLLRVFGSGQAGFEGTFRVVTYSTAANVLSAVPIIGQLLSFFWGMAIFFIGVKRIHHATTSQILFAFSLLALVAILLLGGIAGMILQSAGGGPGAVPGTGAGGM